MVSKLICANKGKPTYRFDQRAPEDVTELEELRSWDHELHFTIKLLAHGRKHACCKSSRNMISTGSLPEHD